MNTPETNDYWKQWDTFDRPGFRGRQQSIKNTLQLLQGHPQWESLRDEKGRSGAMRAVLCNHDIWRALRNTSYTSPYDRDNEGRSLWFYLAQANHETNYFSQPDKPNAVDDMAAWLKKRQPNLQQSHSAEGQEGKGLILALLRPEGPYHSIQCDMTKTLPSFWVRGVQRVLKADLEQWWGGPQAIQEELADYLWRHMKYSLSQGWNNLSRSRQDNQNPVQFVARLVNDFSVKDWTRAAPRLAPKLTTALGAAWAVYHTGVEDGIDKETVCDTPLLNTLWKNACYPGEPLESHEREGLDKLWNKLDCHISAQTLTLSLTKVKPAKATARARL